MKIYLFQRVLEIRLNSGGILQNNGDEMILGIKDLIGLREKLGGEYKQVGFAPYKIPPKSLKNFMLKYYNDKTKEIITEKHEDGVYTIIGKEKVSDDFDITEDGIQWDNLDQNETLFNKAIEEILERY